MNGDGVMSSDSLVMDWGRVVSNSLVVDGG